MRGSTQLRKDWGTLVQKLVDAEGQGIRARILLECVARETWVQACGLWRREQAPDSWACILIRGLPELLPDRDFLEEVAANRTPPDLVPGRGVLLSGAAAGALALTYSGGPASEFDLDLISGLLHVTRLVDAAERQQQPSPVERIVPALPQPALRAASLPRGDAGCQPAVLLRETFGADSEACARSRIRFELELEPGVEMCRILISPPEFVQAVRNLVSNAREALEQMQQGGKIRVSLRRAPGAELLLAVEDNGPGLPQDVINALHSCGPEHLPGPGLGLAVSWGITLGAGGRIQVGESSTSGTRLEFLLPIALPA